MESYKNILIFKSKDFFDTVGYSESSMEKIDEKSLAKAIHLAKTIGETKTGYKFIDVMVIPTVGCFFIFEKNWLTRIKKLFSFSIFSKV